MKKRIYQIFILLMTVGISGCRGSDMGNQTLTTENESQFIERTETESEENSNNCWYTNNSISGCFGISCWNK